MYMKFGIIKERKNPPDRRVVFSPQKLQEFQQQFPKATIVVESSDIRVFSDDAYAKAGFDSKVSETVSIPRTEMMTRKPYFNHLNGEDNYALAA